MSRSVEGAKGKNLHAGHRARMRAKVLQYGLESFDDHQVLEMLLYHAIPRGDTNETAHLLLERFGTFRELLEATPEELQSVEGVGESSAVLLKLVQEVSRRYHIARATRRVQLSTTAAIGRFVLPLFIGKREENIYLLCLDAAKTVIYSKMLMTGNSTNAPLDIPKLLSIVSSVHAKYVVLAHNHPSGCAMPSDADMLTTIQLKKALNQIGVRLLDHLVIADPTNSDEPAGDYISMADSHLY